MDLNVCAMDREVISQIASMSGAVRGAVLFTDAEYVLRHEGEQALQRVEEETRALGYPVDYSKVRAVGWYPASFRGASLYAIRKALDWGDEQLREMGRAAPKYSIITRLMLRYLISLETLMDKLQTYWRRNYTTGSLTGRAAERAVFIHLEGYVIPPLAYPYVEGYFTSVIGMVIGNHKNITMEQIKYIKGDEECYDFILKW